jgi:hypothetical protein
MSDRISSPTADHAPLTALRMVPARAGARHHHQKEHHHV